MPCWITALLHGELHRVGRSCQPPDVLSTLLTGRLLLQLLLLPRLEHSVLVLCAHLVPSSQPLLHGWLLPSCMHALMLLHINGRFAA